MGVLDEQAPSGVPGNPGATPTLTPQVIQKLLQSLKMGGAAMGMGTPMPGATPPTTPGMVGQVGGGGAAPYQTFGAPSAQGAAATPAPRSGQSIPAPQVPMPSQQVSYDSPAAAKAGVVQNLIGGITQMVNQNKQQKQAHTEKAAENDFNQLMTAMQNGDQSTIDAFKNDDARMARMEKALDYYFPREPVQQKKPEKPKEPPPGAQGIKAAVSKFLMGDKSKQAQQQQGNRVMPSPNAVQQLQAMIANRQLQAAQQPGQQGQPSALDQMAGLAPSATEMAKLTTEQRIEEMKTLSAAQLEIANGNFEIQKQSLANEGRMDSSVAVANINLQARVEAAKIMAAASAQRIMTGQMTKEPSATMQNKWMMYQNASDALDTIMKGDSSQGTYNNFVQNLRQAGLSSVAAIVPGQSGNKSIGGYFKSDEKWKAVQKSLGEASTTMKKALTTAYPGWNPDTGTGGGGSAAADSLDNEIMNAIGGGDAATK